MIGSLEPISSGGGFVQRCPRRGFLSADDSHLTSITKNG